MFVFLTESILLEEGLESKEVIQGWEMQLESDTSLEDELRRWFKVEGWAWREIRSWKIGLKSNLELEEGHERWFGIKIT